MICAYCKGEAKLVTGKEIYPTKPHLSKKKYWHCKPCGAYCGCHPKSDRPLGTLANANLRRLRWMAHEVFDDLWRRKHMHRTTSYLWMQEKMQLPKELAHIGMFNEEQCLKLMVEAKKFLDIIE